MLRNYKITTHLWTLDIQSFEFSLIFEWRKCLKNLLHNIKICKQRINTIKPTRVMHPSKVSLPRLIKMSAVCKSGHRIVRLGSIIARILWLYKLHDTFDTIMRESFEIYTYLYRGVLCYQYRCKNMFLNFVFPLVCLSFWNY